MEGIIKMVLLVLIVIYVLSPVDLCPGPIDDIIVVLMGLAANKRINAAT
ncbi:MAG: hypothetical protein IKI31_01415 [Treponema sp.]|nr:hypothetical protein [Treponema sp.]